MLFAGEQSGISMDGHPKRRSLWQQLELEVVATIFIIAASSFLFLKLASEMREGETQAAARSRIQHARRLQQHTCGADVDHTHTHVGGEVSELTADLMPWRPSPLFHQSTHS